MCCLKIQTYYYVCGNKDRFLQDYLVIPKCQLYDCMEFLIKHYGSRLRHFNQHWPKWRVKYSVYNQGLFKFTYFVLVIQIRTVTPRRINFSSLQRRWIFFRFGSGHLKRNKNSMMISQWRQVRTYVQCTNHAYFTLIAINICAWINNFVFVDKPSTLLVYWNINKIYLFIYLYIYFNWLLKTLAMWCLLFIMLRFVTRIIITIISNHKQR